LWRIEKWLYPVTIAAYARNENFLAFFLEIFISLMLNAEADDPNFRGLAKAMDRASPLKKETFMIAPQ
jgi:hypothetical protein